MTVHLNPTSPIRRGYSFQDLWALKKSIEWLKSPNKFQSITIETYPDEISDNHFFIEDIVVKTVTNSYQIFQLKHRQQPDTEFWEWDDFLDQRKGRNDKLLSSLFQKWSTSLLKLTQSANVEEAAFITNGKPGATLEQYLANGKIDIDSIQALDEPLYKRIIDQLGDQSARAFFSEFYFYFNLPSEDQFDEELRLEFCRDLKGTRSGYLSVKDYIYKEANKQSPQPLTLATLREVGEWDQPQPLNEEFHVPDDFVLFDASLHEDLVQRIKSEPGGIGVFVGKPGTGKSTYLSSLAHQLAEQNIIVVKHHYHISTNDPYGLDRLNNERITQALKYQFKQHEEELEEQAYQNSSGITLREFINQLAINQHQLGKSFVLIIDGLDHVLRYWKETELRDFLLEVSQPQNGLWLLFGTQEAAKKYLPQVIFDKCPETDWFNIPGLDYSSTSAVILSNSVGLNLPLDNIEATVEKIFSLTEGNPLHLRYTLQTLKNQLGNTIAYHFNLPSVPPYQGDISSYYNVLWSSLPDSSRTAALVASSMDIGLTKKQLIEIISSIEPNPSTVGSSVSSIYHLLKEQFFGALTIYHNSFRIFIESQSDFAEQKLRLYEVIQKWLRLSSYEYLKWAESQKIDLQLGNPNSIIQLDRDWTIEAILRNRREEDVERLLKLAKNTAFTEQDFPTSIQQNILFSVVSNAFEHNDTEYPALWKVLFKNKVELEIPSDLELEMLPSYQVYYYVNQLHRQGHTGIRKLAIDTFRHRLHNQRYREKSEYNEVIPSTPKYVLKVMCLDKMYPVERAFAFCSQFRSDNWSADLLMVYLKELVISKQYTNVSLLFQQSLSNFERQYLLDFLIQEDCFNQIEKHTALLKANQDELSAWGSLWWQVKTGYFVIEKWVLPDHDSLPYTIENYESKKKVELTQTFHRLWLSAVALALAGNRSVLDKWLLGVTKRNSLQAGSAIVKSALYVAEQVRQNNTINLTDVINELNEFSLPRWENDPKQYPIGQSFTKAAAEIIWNCLCINCLTTGNRIIANTDLHVLLNSLFISEESLLHFLLKQRITILDQAAYEGFVGRELDAWRHEIATFSDRSKRYVALAELALLHNDGERVISFARLAANNLLGYGYHKDLTIYNVLRSVGVCFRAGSHRAIEWMHRLAPLATWVGDFTDGDETRTLIHDYHELLGEIDVAALRRFYYQMLVDEKFDLAESSWNSLVEWSQLDSPQALWLVATAVDNTSYYTLSKRAATDHCASQALNYLQQALGPRQEVEKIPSSYTSEEKTFDYDSVPPKSIQSYLQEWEGQSVYRSRSVISEWAKHWIAKPDQNRRELYVILADLVISRGWDEQDRKFYDAIYELAYEFDEEFAFQCLVYAQHEYTEWDPYNSSDRTAIHQRWQRVKEDFPSRYLEFFRRSVQDNGYRKKGLNDYFVPFPKGIEFFIFMGDLQMAEDITEASLQATEELMADLELPTSTWIDAPERDEIDLLLARQLWVSTITRERVASSLAMLIRETLPTLTVYERWLSWLSAQTLETVIANGLLPILKYAQVQGADFSFISVKAINDAMQYTTIASEELLRELARLVGDSSFRVNIKRRPPFIVPPDYEMGANFKKLSGRFLPPVYSNGADIAEKKFNGIFWRFWSYIVDGLLATYNINADIQAFVDFLGHRSDNMILTGMASLATEVYRSAFLLRTQELYKLKLLANWRYFDFSYQTIPIDLSLWKLQQQRCPDWWPIGQQKLAKNSSHPKPLDTSKSGILEQIKIIINSVNENRVIALDGPLKPASGWIEPLETRVTLVPFAYRVYGPDLPSAEEIDNICHFVYGPNIFSSVTEARPLSYLESNHEDSLNDDKLTEIKDMVVAPLVGRFRHHVINMFQPYRHNPFPFGLFFNLKGDTNLTIADDSIHYSLDNQVVARSYDWTEGISERRNFYLPEPHGQILEIDSQFLDDHLTSCSLKLGFILRVEHTLTESYKDKEDVIQFYELLNVSRIIEP
ncbi:hypothetical protein FAES_3962 [Fibrella aestuarina BUZ 2]|uniref:Uncharacterized protein n=1 Tax=Fibrella aestuarina BUZ 2 TaxID=1166018 RepID=I0KCW2_9BACT|nr:dsDNA nuclease domain-containing protein [Fibrella aestuarina]CCH01965.1 hypothetical protein FAES_3962 [Fibrella aestuarina BUZ 2]